VQPLPRVVDEMLTRQQGTFTVLADVTTKDDKKITCLTAKVPFHR
jgi:hypothetical protein